MSKPIGVGLIGCGTVGSGVVKLLIEHADLYAHRLGRPIQLHRVLCKPEDVGPKTSQVPKGALTHDLEQFFADTADCDVIIELAGGKTFAKQVVEHALTSDKHVVTANKALLASHGRELFKLARDHHVTIAFEASCAGGIPIISAMQFNLLSNQINAIYGIVNGTCNYILTQMTRHAKPYAVALKEAQLVGYAEADPTLDVSGGDSAHKLAILAALAFSVCINDQQIRCSGIDTLDLADIRFARELGYEVKLLAIGQRFDAGLSLTVSPCFIHADQPLAQVAGSFNAVSIFGNAVGHTMFYGRGAGQLPTASAVVGDLMSIIDGAYPAAFNNLKLWPDQYDSPKLIPPGDLRGRYYLRLNAMDKPGVAASFTKALGDHGISIAAVMQHESNAGQFVPVVIVTHETSDGAVANAAKQIASTDITDGNPTLIRIIDFPEG